jgi:hypothetical protein
MRETLEFGDQRFCSTIIVPLAANSHLSLNLLGLWVAQVGYLLRVPLTAGQLQDSLSFMPRKDCFEYTYYKSNPNRYAANSLP